VAHPPRRPTHGVTAWWVSRFTNRMLVPIVTITVNVTTRIRAEQLPRIEAGYGVVLVPIVVIGSSGATRYLLPLGVLGESLTADLSIRMPGAETIAADLAGPPMGAAELQYAEFDEVTRSLDALRSRSALRRWLRLAELLPEDHPVRDLLLHGPEAAQ